MSLSIRTVQELQPHSRAWCKRVRIDGPDQSPPWWLSFKCRGPCLYIRIRRPVMLYLQSIKEISLLTPSPPPALLNTHADGQGSRDTSPSTAGSKWHQCGRNIWNDTCHLYLGSRLRGEERKKTFARHSVNRICAVRRETFILLKWRWMTRWQNIDGCGKHLCVRSVILLWC